MVRLLLLSIVVVGNCSVASAQSYCTMNKVPVGGSDVENLVYDTGVQYSIPIVFHVVTRSTKPQSNVSLSALKDQIDVLNNSYYSYKSNGFSTGPLTNTRFSFYLAGVNRIANDALFDQGELIIAPASGLAPDSHDPASFVNVFTSEKTQNYGISTFPWTLQEGSAYNANWIDYRGITGGGLQIPAAAADGIWDEGDLLVHEIGHFLGLYHYFGGDMEQAPLCPSVLSDLVNDTARIINNLFQITGCSGTAPEGAPMCPGEEMLPKLPPRNFMNYTSDACRAEFTANQYRRMAALTGEHRPTLGLNSVNNTIPPEFLITSSSWMGSESDGFSFELPVRVKPGATLTIKANTELTFESGLIVDAGGMLNVEPGADLLFSPGAAFSSAGQVNAFGSSFKPAISGQGWYGVQFNGGTAILDDTAIEGVNFSGVFFKKPTSAVFVRNGASLTMRNGSSLSGSISAQGIEVVGVGPGEVPSSLVLEGNTTRIELNEQTGLVVVGGASALIRDEATVSTNGSGLYAWGFGSTISLDHANLLQNVGPALSSDGGARIQTVSAGGQSVRTFVNGNGGGLYASSGSDVHMGMVGKSGLVNAGHRYTDNALVASTYDAAAGGASTVFAQGNDWGWQDASCIATSSDASSTLLINPIVPSGATCSAGKAGGQFGLVSEGGDPMANGKMTDGILQLVVEAEIALSDGDLSGAFTILQEALREAGSDDDRSGAFAAAARMLSVAPSPETVNYLEYAATGVARPWALATLVVAHATNERPGIADAVANELIDEYPEIDLAHTVLGIRARLAAQRGDEGAALTHVLHLFAVAPESGAYRAAAAIVGAAFPDAELPEVPPSGGLLANKGDSGALGTDVNYRTEEGESGLRLHPNPTSDNLRVVFPVNAAGTLIMTVSDMLGRAVLDQHVQPVNGESAFESMISLVGVPPGTYILQIRVVGADGQTEAISRRFSIIR